MNKNITQPLIIQITPPETEPSVKRSQKCLFVPVNTPWVKFRDNILPMVNDKTYDSVLVHVRDDGQGHERCRGQYKRQDECALRSRNKDRKASDGL